jgi:putative methyltransferase (TIGR04325 family)
MKKSAIKNNMENDELHFYDNLKDVQDNIDLVHTSSTLHYIDNCYDKILELINLNAKYIVFNRMLFNDSEKDHFMIQHSAYNGIGPGEIPQGFIDKKIDFPIIIMSFGKFNKLLETKYELEWIFNINKRGHEGISLLYVKK